MQIKSIRNHGQNIFTDHHQREHKIPSSSNTYYCFLLFLSILIFLKSVVGELTRLFYGGFGIQTNVTVLNKI